MKLTKKLETEILKLYSKYWDAYLNGKMKTMSSLMDKNCHVIGSGMGEVFKNKKDAVKYYTATACQIAGVSEMRNRNISVANAGNNILVTEESDLYVLMEGSWTFYGQGRVSTLFGKTENKWIIIQQHGSLPDSRTGAGEQINTDKIKEENLRLKEAIKRRTIELEKKNRELEIEASLERVRAIAMGMNKSDDLLSICEVFFNEFKKLGFNNLRNSLINIFNDEEESFVNYDYSDYMGGSISNVSYNSNPANDEFLIKIRKANDAFVESVIDRNQLEEWKEFRRSHGEKDDPRLDNINALYYYNYSIGSGSIGISNFDPIGDEQQVILKRFRNVFDLAYRRYTDIALAEAQAREAEIELALERVRARTMAMQKSHELLEAGELLYKEITKLGIECLTSGYVLMDEIENIGWNYTASPADGKIMSVPVGIPHMETEVMRTVTASWKKGEPYSIIELDPEATITHQTFISERSINFPLSAKELIAISPERIVLHNFNFKHGYLHIVGGVLLTAEQLEMMVRFSKVFEMTYRRFLDLKQAEEQAREAEIELALERVRARTMAMQKSEELKDVIQLVYGQFVHLNIHIEHTGFIIDYKARDDMHIWLADRHELPSEVTIPYFDSPPNNSIMEAKEKGEDFFTYLLNFEEKNKFYQELFKFVPGVPEEAFEYYFNCPGLAGSGVLLENIGLYIENFSGIPYPDEENVILMRFGKVFQQTYTRFLDLQKAEAQAREAQIESALERVRSKAMAMNKSDDLTPAVATVFSELDRLSFRTIRCGIGIFNDFSEKVDAWTTSSDDESGSVNLSGNEVLEGHPLLEGIFKAWKIQKDYSYVLEGKDLLDYYRVTSNSNLPVAAPKITSETTKQYYHCIMFPSGGLFAFRESEFSTEAKNLMRRFADVFQLTFTRHLDLRKAEAQNKLIQAENERKTKELEDARQLQLSMLPRELPKVSNLDIAVYMKTATEVGGDYYDFHIQPDGTLNVLVGDATGHGMMSGMMVSIMKSFFIANRNNFELKSFFENSNISIKDMQLGRLMMACIGLQITSKKLIATNAGMPSLLYFRNKSQKAGEFVINNMPLGAMKGSKYGLKEMNYEKGDTLLLMSDGLAELKNQNQQQYGYLRVKEEFKSVVQKSSNEIIDHLKNSASEWAKGAEPDDDLTFVVIKVKNLLLPFF